MMIERRGDSKHSEPMPPDEAKARIIRFNEGGDLMDFSNPYLSIDDLRMIRDALLYTQQRKDFLYAVMRHASVTAPANESLYSLFRREYKMLRRKANQLMQEINDADPLLF